MIRTQPSTEEILKLEYQEGLNKGLQVATMHARLQIVALAQHLPVILVPGDVSQVNANLQHLLTALTAFEREHTL